MLNISPLCKRVSIKRLLSVFTALFISQSVSATNQSETNATEPAKWYQIEYIIFEHLQTDDHILRYEDTPYPRDSNKQYSYIVHSKHPASPFQFTQLDSKDMVLADAYEKLKKSRAVEILDMAAWQQPLELEATIPPIKIKKEVSNERQLFGELQLTKSRYTHAEFKLFLTKSFTVPYQNLSLWFTNPNPGWSMLDLVKPLHDPFNFTGAIGENKVYEQIRYLGESRRIKESEIHYIDHPVIGAIVTIKEVDPPFQFELSLSHTDF